MPAGPELSGQKVAGRGVNSRKLVWTRLDRLTIGRGSRWSNHGSIRTRPTHGQGADCPAIAGGAMRKRATATWTGAALLVLGLQAAGARAADSADTDAAPVRAPANKGVWFPWLNSAPKETEKQKAEKSRDMKPDPASLKEAEARSTADSGVKSEQARRATEEATLLRRLAVCDQLKLIAVQTHDDSLLRQAEQLEQRVQTAYSRHSAAPATSRIMNAGAPTRDRAKGAARGTASSRTRNDGRRATAAAEEEKP